MMRYCTFVTALLLIPASMAHGQRDTLLAGFDAALRTQILAVVESAERSGVPAEPLLDYARKGRTFGVPSDTILRAVRTRAAKLAAARTLLGRATDAEIIAAEGALDAGVSPETLLEIRRRRPGAVLTTPFGLLGDMMLKGIAKDTAAKVILILTAAGVDDADMDELWSMIQRDIAVGMLPSIAAAERVESLTGGTRSLAADAAAPPPSGNPPTGNPPPPRPIPPQRP